MDGKRIKAIRAKAGMTQPEFAKALGVPVGTLRDWEQSRARPRAAALSLLKLAAARPAMFRGKP